MSIKKIISEAMERNPLGVQEAVAEELKARIRLALEAKEKEVEDDEGEDDDLDEGSNIKATIARLEKALAKAEKDLENADTNAATTKAMNQVASLKKQLKHANAQESVDLDEAAQPTWELTVVKPITIDGVKLKKGDKHTVKARNTAEAIMKVGKKLKMGKNIISAPSGTFDYKKLKESVDLTEGLDKGYYFWDTSNSTIYHEGGIHKTFAAIKKIDPYDFYDGHPDEVDMALAIGYSDGDHFWTVDPRTGKPKKRLSK